MRPLTERLAYAAYTTLWTLLLPFIALYLAVSPRHRPLLGRLRRAPSSIPRDALWVHACSVGEVNAARPLLAALAERMPDVPVFVTVSTRTGWEQAAASLPGIPRAWFPFDHPFLARRFFTLAAPRALVLIETELWPAILHAAQRAGAPVILVNGRFSDKHFDRYRRASWIVTPMVRALAAAGMQSERYAERIASLGLEPSRVQVCGSVKFDGAALEVHADARDRFAVSVQPDENRPLLVVGSTRPGDEARAVTVWEALKNAHPGLQLALALRHPERIAEAERDCAGFPTRRRSACTADDPWQGDDILLLDTFGELLPLYERATLVVIGGSFDPSIQGHNPLEPAALGKPVVFGPHMRNFEEAAQWLLEAGAAQRVASEGELTTALQHLLENPAQCNAMGEAGRAAVRAQQGVSARYANLVAQTVENR